MESIDVTNHVFLSLSLFMENGKYFHESNHMALERYETLSIELLTNWILYTNAKKKNVCAGIFDTYVFHDATQNCDLHFILALPFEWSKIFVLFSFVIFYTAAHWYMMTTDQRYLCCGFNWTLTTMKLYAIINRNDICNWLVVWHWTKMLNRLGLLNGQFSCHFPFVHPL